MKEKPPPPPLELRSAGAKGAGVYAVRSLPSSSLVLRFGGPILRPEEVTDPDHIILVPGGRFLGPSGQIDDYVNHSCDPNCGLRWRGRTLELWALRRVRRGEELTFDYSTCMVDEPGFDPCCCGADACRGAVRAFRDVDPATQMRYVGLDAVPHYVASSAGIRLPRVTRRSGGMVLPGGGMAPALPQGLPFSA